ncbi:tyrosine-type recombinase/integrase [Microbulbifer sp. JMSA003]|uniref:tyrosine-type recombinase/integrase n=1 Tax=Microbulbifer sp. JMSA003 TaxID=3243369 RepID=UPI004039F4A6
MKEVDLYQEWGRVLIKLPTQLLILTFVRPGELRCVRWEDLDFKPALWRVPGECMKMGTDHIMPLSSQALSALVELKSFAGNYSLHFPLSGKGLGRCPITLCVGQILKWAGMAPK